MIDRNEETTEYFHHLGAKTFKPTKTQERTTDSADKLGTGALKYDAGKPGTYRGLVSYFPRALDAVATVSTFGAAKYAWGGWRHVDDGLNRYSDALMRHILSESKGEFFDSDSELPHAAHAAWNALARLELLLGTER
jgi:hypothetical protein